MKPGYRSPRQSQNESVMLILFWLLFIIILLILGLGFVLSYYFTKRGQLGETHSPDEYSLNFETIEFTTSDKLTLRGVFVPARGSDKAVVILHGHNSSHDFDVYRAPYLHEAGFNVLLFDFRAHGRSDGKRMTFGYEERRDVLGAVDFLHERGMHHIGLMGFSYGGVVAMVSTPICPDIEAVIDDGGPARMRTAITARGVEMGFPAWLMRPIAWLTIAMASLRLGVNLFHYEAIRWVGKISPRPILFIQGDQDQYLADFDQLFQAAQPPKEVWRLPDAGHTTASQLYPEMHALKVTEFFKRNL